MKKLILILLINLVIYNASAQVTIGSAAVPQSGSVLDLQSGGNKALLLPRVADTSSITTPSFGMFIYTTGSKKTYFHDGTRWVEAANINTAWSLTGNAGTVDGTNFIGTTDNIPFNIRVNNQKAGRIDNFAADAFFGYQAGNSNTSTGTENTAIGNRALATNTTGDYNTAVGAWALQNNTGSSNTAVGTDALNLNSTGIGNTGLGRGALMQTTLGNQNTGVGLGALSQNTTGNDNVGIGSNSISQNIAGSRNVAIGQSALFRNTVDNNIGIGYYAGQGITTGSNNIVIGFSADVANGTVSNQLNIANNIFGTGLTGSVSAPAGNIGIGTSAPASVLDVNGSFGKAITVLSASASLILNATHSTVIIKSGVTATITLPAPSSCARRTYTIINHNLLGGGSISNYINLLGANSTSLPLIGPITVQSDGNDWYQIQ